MSYDQDLEILYNPNLERTTITSCRDALNGYQKGMCFYYFKNISVEIGSDNIAHIDHFFPHILKPHIPETNVDGVWNLVLACQNCNAGSNGKFTKVPEIKYLERLNKRNNFLIGSHHPLRETLILQTGASEQERKSFLQRIDTRALSYLIHRWGTEEEGEIWF